MHRNTNGAGRKKRTSGIKIFISGILIFVAGFFLGSFTAEGSNAVTVLENRTNEGKISQPTIQLMADNAKNMAIGENIYRYYTDPDDHWQLTLVNMENPLPENFEPELEMLGSGHEFDKRAIQYLSKMLEDAEKQGLSPIVCSAYRSIERQSELFLNQMQFYLDLGFEDNEARDLAATAVAYPGTSEHNLGLAADIVASDYQLLDNAQAYTPEAKWLKDNCHRYGFILRYPEDKTELTGIMFEPWHFRYVGVKAATEIMEEGLCLEEYHNLK